MITLDSLRPPSRYTIDRPVSEIVERLDLVLDGLLSDRECEAIEAAAEQSIDLRRALMSILFHVEVLCDRTR